jgi:hypothetical protein
MRVESEVVSAFYSKREEEESSEDTLPTEVSPTSITGLDRKTCSPKQLVHQFADMCAYIIGFLAV